MIVACHLRYQQIYIFRPKKTFLRKVDVHGLTLTLDLIWLEVHWIDNRLTLINDVDNVAVPMSDTFAHLLWEPNLAMDELKSLAHKFNNNPSASKTLFRQSKFSGSDRLSYCFVDTDTFTLV